MIDDDMQDEPSITTEASSLSTPEQQKLEQVASALADRIPFVATVSLVPSSGGEQIAARTTIGPYTRECRYAYGWSTARLAREFDEDFRRFASANRANLTSWLAADSRRPVWIEQE